MCNSEVTILHKVMREGLISRGIPSREMKDMQEQSTCTVGGGVADRGNSKCESPEWESRGHIGCSTEARWLQKSGEGKSGGREVCETRRA